MSRYFTFHLFGNEKDTSTQIPTDVFSTELKHDQIARVSSSLLGYRVTYVLGPVLYAAGILLPSLVTMSRVTYFIPWVHTGQHISQT